MNNQQWVHEKLTKLALEKAIHTASRIDSSRMDLLEEIQREVCEWVREEREG